MAKILRKTQKIFGQNGNTDEFAVFGTMKNIENGGNPTYSKDIEVLQSDAAFLLGWQSAVVAGFAPFLEELNAVCYALTYQMSYILQNGIPEWDDGTTYCINSIVVGSNAKIYRCKVDDCLNVDPVNDDGTNWYDYELNSANIDLTNLTSTGISFINNSKALLTGEPSSDATIYKDVYYYNHSTFDSSKFTFQNITPTNDGVIKSNGNTNYVALPSITFNTSSTYRLTVRFTTPSTWQSGGYVFTNSTGGFELYIGSSNKGRFNYRKSDGVTSVEVSNFTMELNTTYDAFVEFNLGTLAIKFGYKLANESEYTTASATMDSYNPIVVFQLFKTIGTFTGDLKYVTLYKDGYPVFQGTETGLDTIKPDDYTVAGTPTISADGILSNITSGNYIYKEGAFDFSNAFRLKWSFNIGSARAASAQVILYMQDTTNSYRPIQLEINSAGNLYLNLRNFSGGSANTFIASWKLNDADPLPLNQVYYYELIYNGIDTYTIYRNGVFFESKTSVEKVGTVDRIYFYCTGTGTYPSIYPQNLNNFQIYVNGNLIYQPCLKIPYSESKTGSKVVDVAYRDRVSSMYEQEGYAPYYTIDEANKNFTLPMGEIYGLEDKLRNVLKEEIDNTPHIIDAFSEGTSWGRIYSDGFKMQGGVVSGTAQNIPIPSPVLTENGTTGGASIAVFANSEYNANSRAYKAFDGNSASTGWIPYPAKWADSYIGIYFPNPVTFDSILWQKRKGENNNYILTCKIQYSSDGLTWTDLGNVITPSYIPGNNNPQTITPSTSGVYSQYWRIYLLTGGGSAGCREITFNNLVMQISGVSSITFPEPFNSTGYTYSLEALNGSVTVSAISASGITLGTITGDQVCWSAMGY